jgi:hypothetical protein
MSHHNGASPIGGVYCICIVAASVFVAYWSMKLVAALRRDDLRCRRSLQPAERRSNSASTEPGD